MPRYFTPGVYRSPRVEERTDIRLVRTDVAGFVGFAERGPLLPLLRGDDDAATDYALRLTSWDEYRLHFGGFITNGFLPWAVRGFFENGGTLCYVLRVAATADPDPAKRPASSSCVVPARVRRGLALTADRVIGAQQLKVDTTAGLVHGDLLEVQTDGLTERLIVGSVLDATTILLQQPATAEHKAGNPVTAFVPGFTLTATSAGSWGDRIRARVTRLEIVDHVQFFALRISADPPPGETRPEEERFTRISIGDAARADYAPAVLAGTSHLVRMTFDGGAEESLLGDGVVWLTGGRDGVAAATVEDFTGTFADTRGLRLLEEIDEISMITVPDAVYRSAPSVPEPPLKTNPCSESGSGLEKPPHVEEPALDDEATRLIHARMIEQCSRLRYRVAILDSLDEEQPRNVQRFFAPDLRQRDWRFAAAYYPWLKVPDLTRTREAVTRRVAPSGHVAGIYARNDHLRGVHHAPANLAMEFVTDVGLDISDELQESLNEDGIDVIRAFPGRGIRVWGARSLSLEQQWRFIHVRRLLSYIEECIEHSAQWTVFRSNDADLRRALVHSLNVFLEGIRSTGGLKGASSAESFYVKCDDTNNSPATVDAGLLICEIGVAIAAPMEFIVFELRQSVTGADVAEALS